MDRNSAAYPSVAAAAVAAVLRRAATSARSAMRVPASFAEASLWRVVSTSDRPGVRNRAWAALIEGPLDTAALRQSLADLIERHDALRAGFLEADGSLWRTAVPQRWVRMPIDDFSHGANANVPATATLWAQRLASRAIDLAQAPLVRLGVARFGPHRHALVLVMHRLVADRPSQALMLRELGERYAVHRAMTTGRQAGAQAAPVAANAQALAGQASAVPAPLEVAPSYTAWAQALRSRVQADAYAPVRLWWSHRLEGCVPLTLRTDRPRPARASFAGGSEPVRIDAARARALSGLAMKAGVTPSVALMSVWQLVLAQCTDQREVVMALPVTHRERMGTDRMLGAMADQLPLRIRLDGLHDVGALLAANRRAVSQVMGLRGAPWGLIASGLPCRAAFSMDPRPTPSLELAGCRVSPMPLGDEPCFHDLALHFEPHGDEFEGALSYARELFEPETARRIAAHVGVLLDAVLARPDALLAELPRL